ncbi:DUF1822 family protein [Geitlerinema sp. CS-897]|nr:DUF1822 family protein [Geitlerinema sp. CS-897]
MTFLVEPLTFTSSLTTEFLLQAQAFSREQRDSQKARKVYLNTLAVCAVHFYCECTGVETDLTASNSWNAATRTLTNAADLVIQGKGRLECCPVLPGDEVFQVSPEAREDRLGYVVVEIDEAAYEARLLGFSQTAESQLYTRKLSSLEALLEAIVDDVPETDRSAPSAPSVTTGLVRLSQWFSNVFDELWQDPERVLAASYRGVVETQEPDSQPSRKRVKMLDVGGYKIALLLQTTYLSDTERDILLKVCPGDRNVLPQGLLLQLLDDSDSVVMQTQTKRADNFISLNFQIGIEEAFSVQLSLKDSQVTEQFLS